MAMDVWQRTRPINCGDRSICGRERCDGQVVGPPMVIYSSGKNKRMAAASVDLSTGEKVKILYGRHSWPCAREFNSAGRRQMLWLTGPDSGSAGLETNFRSTTVSTHQFHYGHPPTTPPQHRHRTWSRLTYIMYIYYSHLSAIFRSAAAINPIIGTAISPSLHPRAATLCPTRTTTTAHTYNNNCIYI